MTHSKHSKHSKHGHHHVEKKAPLWGLHKDWRAWLVLGLMLAAMGIYVLSLDESVQPEISITNPAPPPAAGPPK